MQREIIRRYLTCRTEGKNTEENERNIRDGEDSNKNTKIPVRGVTEGEKRRSRKKYMKMEPMVKNFPNLMKNKIHRNQPIPRCNLVELSQDKEKIATAAREKGLTVFRGALGPSAATGQQPRDVAGE